MMNNQYNASISKLVQAAESFFNDNAYSMSDMEVAQWAYLVPAQGCIMELLHVKPGLLQDYTSWTNEINARYSKGILTTSEYIDHHVSLATSMIVGLNKGIDLEPVGSTLFDNDLLHVWMKTGTMLDQSWCDTMPWSPEWSIAKENFTMFLQLDEAIDVANQWNPGEWSSMHYFAETGRIMDLYSFCKELDECITEAGQNPLYATKLYNLYATICLLVQDAADRAEDIDFS